MMPKKKKNQLSNIWGWVMLAIGILVSVGIGGLFVNGTFTTTAILNWIPRVVHTITGWIIIASSLVGGFLTVTKKI